MTITISKFPNIFILKLLLAEINMRWKKETVTIKKENRVRYDIFYYSINSFVLGTVTYPQCDEVISSFVSACLVVLDRVCNRNFHRFSVPIIRLIDGRLDCSRNKSRMENIY